MALATPTEKATSEKKWKTMTTQEKAIFVAKLTVMICTGGFVFGNVLTEDMDYEKL